MEQESLIIKSYGFIFVGNSSKKKAIIGGVVGGGGLVLILAAVFLWYKVARKPETATKGNSLQP